MYDTVNSYERNEARGLSLLASFGKHLDNVSEHFNASGETWISGSLKNYKVSVSDKSYHLKGSLPKFYLNDNFKVLGRSETERAIEKISDLLHWNISKGKVTRLDIGQNFILNNPPEHYLKYLGQSKYFTRLEQKGSLYYTNSQRVLCFYNKLAELRKKRVNIPSEFRNSNILRYELRFTQRLTRQLNQPEITIKDLYSDRFYIDMINRWVKEFETIDKINDMRNDITGLKQAKPKDLKDLLAAERIKEIGLNKVLKMIDEELKQSKAFARPEYYTRAKQLIRDLYNKPEQSIKTEHIKELSNQVHKITDYYR